MNENPAMCTKCGGLCCRAAPGRYHPTQLGLPGELAKDQLRSAVEDGLIEVFDRLAVGFKGPAYYLALRPARMKKQVSPYPSEDAYPPIQPCRHWSESGCELGAEKRPLECQFLVPMEREGGPCVCKKEHEGKIDEAWDPYADFLFELLLTE